MADEFVVVEGLDELATTMDNIPYRLASRVQRTALQAGGEVFLGEMVARCPVAPKASHPDSEPGEMRDACQVKIRLGQDLDESTAKIGPGYTDRGSEDPGVYVKFVEYGTKNMAAEPFMRPAYDAAKETAQEAYTGVVSELLDTLTEGRKE